MLNTFENKDRFHERRLERERHMATIDVFSAVKSEDDAAVSSVADALSGLPLQKEEEQLLVQSTSSSPHRTLLLWVGAFAAFIIVTTVSVVAGMNYQKENGVLEGDIGIEVKGSQSARFKRIDALIMDWGLTPKAQLKDEASPAAKALKWLVNVDTNTESTEDLRTRYALATLYFSTQDPTAGFVWQRSTNWLSELPVCLWYGVYCHESDWDSIELNSVGSLNVSANGLVNTIPPEISLLGASIHSLDLSNNLLIGTIPSSLGLMRNLRDLYLGPNNLSSTLPSSIAKINSLNRMYINDCHLTGTIPTEIASLSTLQALDLSENLFRGTLPRLAELTDLLILYLDDNSLTGLIPALPVSLVDLRLRMNMLSGEIPTEIGDLVVLQTCYLDSNLLAGEIPTAFERNVLLQDLHLYNNRLSGGIPSSFGRLENMRILYLDHNNLSSSLAPELGLMRSLGKHNPISRSASNMVVTSSLVSHDCFSFHFSHQNRFLSTTMISRDQFQQRCRS